MCEYIVATYMPNKLIFECKGVDLGMVDDYWVKWDILYVKNGDKIIEYKALRREEDDMKKPDTLMEYSKIEIELGYY